MFVAVEGIDGSGKGTQTKLLREKLDEAGYEVKHFSFPSYNNTVYGKLVGKYLNNIYGDLPIEIASTLFAVDRFEKRKELLAAIEDCDIVLCDRWCPSNMAYSLAQKFPQKAFLPVEQKFAEWINNVDYGVFEQPVPDTVFHLQISPEKAADLVAKKEQRCYTDAVKDKYEADLAFQTRVADLYDYLVSKTTSCQNWQQINVEQEDGKLKDESKITDELVMALYKFGF